MVEEFCADSPSEGRIGRAYRGLFYDEVIWLDMGERTCYLAVCPECDLQVSIADDTCPECGAELDTEG
jgi:predicted amidophosphoribosyltransferase